jgi:hypothetical protein
MSENNDKLMEQFIERATPKLFEALQESVSKHVEEQIGGLKDSATKLLDEVKDAQRERTERDEKQQQDFDQLKTLLERGGTPREVHQALSNEPMTITREQARDPQLYRRAKAQAEQAGTTLQIVKNA